MPQKKQQSAVPSPEEQAQVQQLVADYQQIAQALAGSTTPEEEERALAPVTSLSESAQIAYLKALSKEPSVGAANIITVMNALAPIKEVRKEAHRSLIRLEGERIYPSLTPLSTPAPAIQSLAAEESTTPPRFWKGFYSDTRDAGQIQLLLCWEQGENYTEARLMGFLLDFWQDGVKDFFSEVSSKRRMEEHIESMKEQMADFKFIDCTLAQARSLLQEALDVNKKQGTRPYNDYTRHLPLIRTLVLEAPDAEEAGDEDASMALTSPQSKRSSSPFGLLSSFLPSDELAAFESFFSGMVYQEVVGNFLDAWSEGDYEAAYDMLSQNSPLRDGLTRTEWADLRSQWSEEAHPTGINIAFIEEPIDVLEEALEDEEDEELDDEIEDDLDEDELEDDLDNEIEGDLEDEQPILDVGWSLEYADSPLAQRLPELPLVTAFFKETGRHWFWSSYTLVQEEGEWRIENMLDRGAQTMHLSREELQQRLDAVRNIASARYQELMKKADIDLDEEEAADEDLDEEDIDDEHMVDTLDDLQDALQISTQGTHFADALIAQAPKEDPEIYIQASGSAAILQDFERAAVYQQRLAENFPDQRAEALRLLAFTYVRIASQAEENEQQERAAHFMQLNERTLREAIAVDSAPISLIMLAQTLIVQNKRIEEAEDLLRQAEDQSPTESEQALIAIARGKIAENRGDLEQALQYYQQAATLNPDHSGLWYNIGSLQSELDQDEEAEESFLRSIEKEPERTEAYVELASLYAEKQGDFDKALDILEQGLEENEGAADILAEYALVHTLTGNLREAELYLEQAEDSDPNLELVKTVRLMFDAQKAEQRKAMKAKREQKAHKSKSKKRKR